MLSYARTYGINIQKILFFQKINFAHVTQVKEFYKVSPQTAPVFVVARGNLLMENV